MCFEFAREANFRKSTIPEYKREYEEIEIRCEEYAISLLEQCEDLREVEIFLQTRDIGTKDTSYMLAILDSRMKIVAHERFQYVLLKKFGETELEDEYDACTDTLWIDMPMYSRILHVLKQVPCYLLLFLYPLFYPCLFPSEGQKPPSTPWFCKEWRVPLNRAIYTAFSYICFICLILCYVTEPSVPYIYWVDGLLGIFITSYMLRDIGTAFFLWRLEGPNPNGRRFKKRYFTFWNYYNIVTDLFFFIGLIIRMMAYILPDSDANLAAVEASGRIFWGVAFTLAVFKMIKIGIVSKHFGPIILSMKAMLKDIVMFLITFFVIMLAFSCGVSYMFNYIGNSEGASTSGIFTYFFWVLLQPFRGNPNYDEVTNLPYDTSCISSLLANKSEININSIAQCKMETMYNSSCIASRIMSMVALNLTTMPKGNMHDCIKVRRLGEQTITTAVVPMWIIYQFLVSVVLLRILIVMMTITYKKIYDNLDTQWKYWRLYLAIQFFDSDSLLPPPFTHLTLLMYLIRWAASLRPCSSFNQEKTREAVKKDRVSPQDTEYRNLLFAFIDNVKPVPKTDKKKGATKGADNSFSFLESM